VFFQEVNLVLVSLVCVPGAYLEVVKLVSDYVKNINFTYFLCVFFLRARELFLRNHRPSLFSLVYVLPFLAVSFLFGKSSSYTFIFGYLLKFVYLYLAGLVMFCIPYFASKNTTH